MLRAQVRTIPRLTVPCRSLYTSVLDSDINITKNGKVNLSVGPGGRSSRTGYTATVLVLVGSWDVILYQSLPDTVLLQLFHTEMI